MNLRGFKKIHEDDKKAVLQNQRGHKITLAKSQLSKNHISDLGRLPLYGGGDVPEEFEPGKDYSNSPLPGESTYALAPEPEPMPMPQPTPPEQPVDQDSPPPMAEEPPQPQRQPTQQQSPQQTQQTPEMAAQAHAAPHVMEANNEAVQYAQDLQNGHITPQTYQSMFAQKDTLGKIGTLFGLMLSGAGSGLAHQPNALLEMMNKQIDNDLAAQKQSKENALNYYRLNQQNELNKANIKQTGAETLGTIADTQLKADTHAKNQMLLTALHSMQDGVNKLPQGPQRMQAQQTLDGVRQAGAAEIEQNNQRLGQAVVSNPEGAFQKQQKNLRMMGMLGMEGADTMAKANDERHVPGVGESSIPVPDQVRNELIAHKKLEDSAKDLFDFTKKHTTLVPGMPAYNVGEQKAEVLRQMIREGMLGTVFRESEKPLLEKFVPQNPGGFLKIIQSQPKLKSLLESNAMQANALREHYGLPNQSAEKQSDTAKTGTYKGKPVIMQNGKWKYK